MNRRSGNLQLPKFLGLQPGLAMKRNIAESNSNLPLYSQAKLIGIARKLNERPQKTLNHETPAQRFTKPLHPPVESTAHSGQSRFSKPVSQPNPDIANWSAPKRPLATSPNRPQPVGGECRSIADVHLDGCSEAVIDPQLAN